MLEVMIPERLVVHFKEVIERIMNTLEQIHCREDLDYVNFKVKDLLNLLLRCNELFTVDGSILEMIGEVVQLTERPFQEVTECGYKAPKKKSGCKGRPYFLIYRGQLEFCLENNFSVPAIAKMISVSESTVKRRLKKFELSVVDTYTDISEQELDQLVNRKSNRTKIVDTGVCLVFLWQTKSRFQSIEF